MNTPRYHIIKRIHMSEQELQTHVSCLKSKIIQEYNKPMNCVNVGLVDCWQRELEQCKTLLDEQIVKRAG